MLKHIWESWYLVKGIFQGYELAAMGNIPTKMDRVQTCLYQYPVACMCPNNHYSRSLVMGKAHCARTRGHKAIPRKQAGSDLGGLVKRERSLEPEVLTRSPFGFAQPQPLMLLSRSDLALMVLIRNFRFMQSSAVVRSRASPSCNGVPLSRCWLATSTTCRLGGFSFFSGLKGRN